MLRDMTKPDLATLRLETPRLILRPPCMEDFDAWAAFLGDEMAARYIGGPQSRATAWRTFMCMCGAWSMAGVSMFSVIEKASGRWIGRLGPWQPEEWPGTEVGWGIAREYWGRGYASEGSAAAMDYAFDVLGWTEVIHCIDEQNASSRGVAKRLGSSYLRRVRLPAPYDGLPIEAWGQTREDWRRNRV
jgi:RimJ/RimL family protein N-acetyltransferase